MAQNTLRDHLKRLRETLLLIPRLDQLIALSNNAGRTIAVR